MFIPSKTLLCASLCDFSTGFHPFSNLAWSSWVSATSSGLRGSCFYGTCFTDISPNAFSQQPMFVQPPPLSCYLSCHLCHWSFWITSSVLSTAIQLLYFRICPLSDGRMCLPALCGVSHVEIPDHCIHSSLLPLTPKTTPVLCNPLLSPAASYLLVLL